MESSDMAAETKDGGNNKRFSGNDLDGKAYRQWKLWARAKMLSLKDIAKSQKGPFVYCLLDGVALEAVEHLQLDDLTKEDGDDLIWRALDERFPDKMQHDHMSECLREVFGLGPREGETIAEWTSKVTETFTKCKRKVSIEFPAEAQGWICLNQSGLSEDQRAIVTAKTQGDLRLSTVIASMRSCFPDFKATSKCSRLRAAAGAMMVDGDEEWTEEDVIPLASEPAGSTGDAVIFEDVEAFLGEHGVQMEEIPPGDYFSEKDTVEILAASWREKRAEIARLQKSRRFSQANIVKKKFVNEVGEVRKQTRCFKCNKVGHWARNCPNKSSKSDDKSTPFGASVVWEACAAEESMLVSSPGFGIIDSGCGKTLIGQSTLATYMRMLYDMGKPSPTLKQESTLFRFGNGQEEVSDRVATLPVGIHGHSGTVEAAVIKGDAPLLLSRNTMRSLRAVMDFAAETVSIQGGPPQKLVTNAAGQFVINVMEFSGVDRSLISSSSPCSVINEPSKKVSMKENRCLMAQSEAWGKNLIKEIAIVWLLNCFPLLGFLNKPSKRGKRVSLLTSFRGGILRKPVFKRG